MSGLCDSEAGCVCVCDKKTAARLPDLEERLDSEELEKLVEELFGI